MKSETNWIQKRLQEVQKQKLLKKIGEQNKWVKGDLEQVSLEFPSADYSSYEDMTCTELFECFFDDDIMNLICEETRNYALYKNQVDPNISVEDLKCFLGILILTGYNSLPSKRHYWDINEDLSNKLVTEVMRRNRFDEIQKYIHFANNTKIDESDKMWKLRPLMDKLKKKCLDNFVPVKNLSYDEAMIKYFGRHGCKQFIRDNHPLATKCRA